MFPGPRFRARAHQFMMSKTDGVRGPAAAAATVVLAAFGTGGLSVWFAPGGVAGFALVAAIALVTAAVGAAVVSLLASARLRKSLAPLAAFARELSSQRDFSRRAPAATLPELAPVAEAVDELLLQVQFRDQQIERQKEQLEEEVGRRTAQLERTMEELRAARDRAEESGRSKAMFLANMSHEIRTPMNGIIGMADLVLESTLTPQQAECLETIRSSAESLTTIINDVLDFSKIEAGRLELNPEKFRLRESLASAMNTLALGAEAKGLELVWKVAGDVPDALVGDAGRLRQVLVNLIGNSVKFTEQGEVAVGGELESTSLGQVVLRFQVRDTGNGIAPEDRPRLFRPFEQADNSATRRFGGTGLGLAIVHQLTQLMGGRTWFESEVGRGSSFFFTVRLGLQRDVETPPAAAGLETVAGRRVLLVDDNALARDFAAELIASLGLAVEAADGAAAALARIEEAKASGLAPFDAALIDARMPGVDGFALARELTSGGVGPPVVMMLSQTGRLDAAARAQSMGVAAYVPKPLGRAELAGAFRVAFGLEAPPAPVSAWGGGQSAAVPAGPQRVLLAEDNPVNRALAQKVLEPRGHSVRVACDGIEAVDAALGEPFDVILMDVSMPRMDGLQATEAIRRLESPQGRRTRIVALTAHALKGDRERCLAAGMDGYMTKPIRPGQLCEVVEKRSMPAEVEAEPAAQAPSDEPATSEIARETLLEKFDGNLEAFTEIATVYLENVPRFLSDITRALESRDLETLAGAAHSLKGTLTIFSVESAYRCALRMEKQAKAGELEGAAATLPALKGEVERLDAALKRVLAPG
ncbi:MAG: response regulator [Candidatus Wallbacteria bacterium]|nr:response regulator [Candidatus Wallbacteria bacterium]